MTSLKKQPIARVLAVLAGLALPALAAAPADAPAQAAGFDSASTPVVGTRNARVIVKYKADGALMRESTQSARDPDRVVVQHAARRPVPCVVAAAGAVANAGRASTASAARALVAMR